MKTISRKVLVMLAALVILVNSIGMLALTASAANENLIVSATIQNGVTKVKKGEKFIVTYKMENYAAAFAALGGTPYSGYAGDPLTDGKVGRISTIALFINYNMAAFTPSPVTRELAWSDEEEAMVAVAYTSVTKPLLNIGTYVSYTNQDINAPGDGTVRFVYLSSAANTAGGSLSTTTQSNLFQVEFTALSDVAVHEYDFTIDEPQSKFVSWKQSFPGVTGAVWPRLISGFKMTVENQTAVPLVTDALDSAIFDAGVILGGAVQGTNVGQYSAGAYAAFDGAIDTANGVLTDALSATPTVTQTQIDDAVTALTTAQSNFKARTADGNSAISKISLVNGTLNQAFNPAITEYTITMAKAINWINIYPEVSKKASFEYQNAAGAKEVTPNIFMNVVIPELQKIIKIQVTAQDSTITTYTFTINKPVVIKDVAVTFGQFTGINDELGTISVTANANATYVNISPFVAPGLSYTINGDAVRYASINVLGQTSVQVQMVVSYGATSKPYTVTITKAQDIDNSVKKLDLAGATVSDSIINVTPGATSFLIVPIVPLSATYKLIVGGTDVTKAGRYQATTVPSTPGLVVEVVVKAENGIEATTTYTVARAESTNNALTNLDLTYATKSGLTSGSTITTKQYFCLRPYVIKMATAKVFRDDTNVQISPATGATWIYNTQNIHRIRIEVRSESGATENYYFDISYLG